MLDTRNNYHQIIKWIATVAITTLTVTVCFSQTYHTQSIIGLCMTLLLLCVIGLSFNTKTIQHFRPIILFCSLIYFGFIVGGCPCILFYFQGFILFVAGNTAFWIPFVTIISILILSVIFGPVWCGWLCWLGALQEFIFKQNKWKILSSKKSQKILFYIQTLTFVVLGLWLMIAQRPIICTYDPFISIVRLKIFNWVGYITVPLLLLSSLFIYRPFCRIICPIGWLLFVLKYLPFTTKLKISRCTDCKKCHAHCHFNAIQKDKIFHTCNFCGECKKANCNSIIIQ
ncbi:MAG: 4Fe-4S binding protein [Lentimicrobiaceae bacterium]|nr:4Fe-4S binding protein [Lentimicrobiaceae bacterium]